MSKLEIEFKLGLWKASIERRWDFGNDNRDKYPTLKIGCRVFTLKEWARVMSVLRRFLNTGKSHIYITVNHNLYALTQKGMCRVMCRVRGRVKNPDVKRYLRPELTVKQMETAEKRFQTIMANYGYGPKGEKNDPTATVAKSDA